MDNKYYYKKYCKYKNKYLDLKNENKYYDSNGNEMVQHLHNISILSQKMGIPIFPRNGFLLGIVRHKGFLPNEHIDADLACFIDDVPKILNSDWGDYEIKYVDYKLNEVWDRDFFNGEHPVSGKSLDYYDIKIGHKHSQWGENIGIFYKYKPGYYYYPWWSIKKYNSENEFKLNTEIYNEGKGGGWKILLGYEELPLKDLYKDEYYKGKVGTMYNMSDFETFISAPFYDTFIYIPIGSKNILINDYGTNVLDYMIDKNGNKEKLNELNVVPKKL